MADAAEHNRLIGYAQDFVSFLVSGDYLKGYTIRNIILYGSVARGDFTQESDVDIFIDCMDPDSRLGKEAGRSVDEFFTSIWFDKWKRLGVGNMISCMAGRIEDAGDLRISIISDGIVLYGKYSPETKGKAMALFVVGGMRPEKKRVFLTRKLFGYTLNGKPYSGIVSRYGGEKLSSGCFIVPVQFSKSVSSLLREKKASFKVREISTIE